MFRGFTRTRETILRTAPASLGGKRVFLPNETYHPKDLNDENLQPYLAKRKEAARSLGLAQSANGTHNTDLFKEMGWDALKMYKRPEVLSHFVTEMGYIKPRRDTGLTQQNQRRLSKAIKRAQHFGLMPLTYNAFSTGKY